MDLTNKYVNQPVGTNCQISADSFEVKWSKLLIDDAVEYFMEHQSLRVPGTPCVDIDLSRLDVLEYCEFRTMVYDGLRECKWLSLPERLATLCCIMDRLNVPRRYQLVLVRDVADGFCSDLEVHAEACARCLDLCPQYFVMLVEALLDRVTRGRFYERPISLLKFETSPGFHFQSKTRVGDFNCGSRDWCAGKGFYGIVPRRRVIRYLNPDVRRARLPYQPSMVGKYLCDEPVFDRRGDKVSAPWNMPYDDYSGFCELQRVSGGRYAYPADGFHFHAFGLGVQDLAKELKDSTDKAMIKLDEVVEHFSEIVRAIGTVGITVNNNVVDLQKAVTETAAVGGVALTVGMSVYEFTMCVLVGLSVMWVASRYGLLDNVAGLAMSVIAAVGLGAAASPVVKFVLGLLQRRWADSFDFQASGLASSFVTFFIKEAFLEYFPMPTIIKKFIAETPRSVINTVSLKDMLVETLAEMQDLVNLVRNTFGMKPVNVIKTEARLVDAWIWDVESFILEIEQRSSGVSMTDTHRLKSLLSRYDLVRKTVDVKSRFYHTISQKFSTLLNYSATIAALAGAKERPEPVFILIYGAAGCGKSSVFQHLVRYLLAKFFEGTGFIKTIEDLDRQVYQTCTDKFWNGWDNQAAVICDDIFQVPPESQGTGDGETDAMKVIRMINSVQYPLLSASVEDKGKKYFNAKLVVGSTNREKLTNEVYKTISDPNAIFRRIHFGLRLVPGEGFKKEDGVTLDLDKIVATMKENGGRVTDDMFTLYPHNFFGNDEKATPMLYSELLNKAHRMMVSNHEIRRDFTQCIDQGLKQEFGFQAGGLSSHPLCSKSDELLHSRPSLFSRVWHSAFPEKKQTIDSMLALTDEFEDCGEAQFEVKVDTYYDYVLRKYADWFRFVESNWWASLATCGAVCASIYGVVKLVNMWSNATAAPKPSDPKKELIDKFALFVEERGLDSSTLTYSNLRSFMKVVQPGVEYQATEQARAIIDKVSNNRCSLSTVSADENVFQVSATFISSDVLMVNRHFEIVLASKSPDVFVEMHSLTTGELVARATRDVFLAKMRSGVTIENTELCLFHVGVNRSFCDIRKFFVNDDDVRPGNIEGMTMMGHYENAHGPEHRLFSMGQVNYRAEVHCPGNYGTYSPRCEGHFVYNVGAKAGDCGSLLVQAAVDPHQCRKLYGVHYGAAGIVNYACLVTRGRVERAMVKLNCVPTPDVGGVAPTTFTFNAGLPSLVPVGRVRCGANTPGRSTLFLSRWGKVGPFGDHFKKPAILRPNGLHNPMKKALSKVATPVLLLDRTRLRRVCFGVMSRHSDASISLRREVLSFETAVQGDPSVGMNGIPRSTSSGYPLNIQGHRDKTSIFGAAGPYDFSSAAACDIKAKVERVEEVLKKGQRPSGDDAFIWMDFLKDELLPIPKVDDGKARMISCAPLVYTILFRMYFGDFMQSIQQTRIYNGIAIGCNPYKEWSNIASHVQAVGVDVVAGDFSGFDASEVPDVHSVILDYINAWYGDSELNQLVRRVLWEEVTNSLHIGGWGNYKDILYFWTKSLPSGHPATGIINSMYGLILFGLCFEDLVGDIRRFWELVRPIVLGDDNTLGISREIIGVFNQLTIADCMSKYGAAYTDDTKGVSTCVSRLLTEVSFLKRRFVFCQDVSQWLCPLEWSSVSYMGYYCRTAATEVEDLSMCVVGALRESVLHGFERHSEYVSIVRSGFRAAGLTVPADFVMPYSELKKQVLYDPKVYPWDYETIFQM